MSKCFDLDISDLWTKVDTSSGCIGSGEGGMVVAGTMVFHMHLFYVHKAELFSIRVRLH